MFVISARSFITGCRARRLREIQDKRAYPRTLSGDPIMLFLITCYQSQLFPFTALFQKSLSSSTRVKCTSFLYTVRHFEFCALTFWQITFHLKIDERGSWWVQSLTWGKGSLSSFSLAIWHQELAYLWGSNIKILAGIMRKRYKYTELRNFGDQNQT